MMQTSLLNTFGQCEKHSKKEEALAKVRDGIKFDEVAREFSEDKARQGMKARRLPSDGNPEIFLRWLARLESPVCLSWEMFVISAKHR